jgi:hypothetical protein
MEHELTSINDSCITKGTPKAWLPGFIIFGFGFVFFRDSVGYMSEIQR